MKRVKAAIQVYFNSWWMAPLMLRTSCSCPTRFSPSMRVTGVSVG